MKKSLLSLVLCVLLVGAMWVTPVNSYSASIADNATVAGSKSSAVISGTDVDYTAIFPKAPQSDDGKLYLFELKTFEYGIPTGAAPIASTATGTTISLRFPLNYTPGYSRLYNKFVLAAKRGASWVLVNNAQYITNPEAVATSPKARQPRAAKQLQRGNVANISLNGSGIAQSIGAQHAVFTNTDPNVVTADRRQAGDSHPVKRNPVVAYMLNADDDAGVAGLIADMTAYAGGISNLQDFVIGNEVNERCWNYMAWCDWDSYIHKYIQAFRVCYTAIKSTNPNARVYISLDQVWNKNPKGTKDFEYIDGDEFLAKFNSYIVANGNIDWDVSIHPYPNPLYYAKFWDLSGLAGGANFKAQVDTDQVITFQNLSTLTNVLATPAYANRSGGVRDVIIGEIGLGSNAGVDNQAAAICASWAAFERNPYITQYMYLEVDVNGFFPTMTGKALECYNAMGTPEEAKYMSWALNHIGIKDWSQVLR